MANPDERPPPGGHGEYSREHVPDLYEDGLSIRQISAKTGIPMSTVYGIVRDSEVPIRRQEMLKRGADPFVNAIGDQLRDARDALGWTRVELAEKLSCRPHWKTVQHYEFGTVTCSVSVFQELCDTLGLSAQTVLAEAQRSAEIGSPRIRLERRERAERAKLAAQKEVQRKAKRARTATWLRQEYEKGRGFKSLGREIGESPSHVKTLLREAGTVLRSSGR
jgi:ribosome-binding protein aMBF1 (putative translation factor)